MFQVEMIGSSGLYNAPVLQVAGVHSKEIDRDNSIYHSALTDLPLRNGDFWGETISRSLLERVVREAAGSDLFQGESPETYSPLGKIDLFSIGKWTSTESLINVLIKSPSQQGYAPIPPTEQVEFNSRPINATGSAVLSARRGEEVIGAMVYGIDSFVVPVPVGTSFIDVRYRPDGTSGANEQEEIRSRLAELIDDEPVQQLLLWRLYLGSNTISIDGATPAESGRHSILARVTRQTGFLVGRIVYSVSRLVGRDANDPTAHRRRMKLELNNQATADACMDIRTVDDGAVTDAVIAIHGTMACAISLAAACRPEIRPDVPILRFEHDTWLPIHHNVNELVQEIKRVGCKNLLFVAHSRGGLVARHTAEMLASTGEFRIRHLTLGSPFLGTPIADAVNVGLLGTRVLLGGLRALGGTVVDSATRIAGLMIRAQLPRGIEAMREDSTYLSGFNFRQLENTIALSGSVDLTGGNDSYGLSFGLGFALSVFGEANDLIVAASSSSGGLDGIINVSCDHFSYILQPEFLTALSAQSQFLTGSPVSVRARQFPKSKPSK